MVKGQLAPSPEPLASHLGIVLLHEALLQLEAQRLCANEVVRCRRGTGRVDGGAQVQGSTSN